MQRALQQSFSHSSDSTKVCYLNKKKLFRWVVESNAFLKHDSSWRFLLNLTRHRYAHSARNSFTQKNNLLLPYVNQFVLKNLHAINE